MLTNVFMNSSKLLKIAFAGTNIKSFQLILFYISLAVDIVQKFLYLYLDTENVFKQ